MQQEEQQDQRDQQRDTARQRSLTSPPSPPPSKAAGPVAAEPLSLHRNIDIAVAIRPDLQGYFAIGDGLHAHVVPAAIVDLLIRAFVDAEDHHHATARLKSAARQPLASEAQLLALPGLQ